ncbi:MAG: glycosyltransferase family 2 protein [Candidatus Schekmanbacteria bacterium]|nr:glycosyltransferase family 2 protein [Candidatus Schekmanbacteria bacterium]
MKFSIIVPVYNGSETLEKCLGALCHIDYPKDDYEIVVINDGSQDNSAQIACRFPVRLITLAPNQGRIIARQTGAKSARYDNLLFIDARVIVSPDILKQIERIDYQPLMSGEHGEDKYRSHFDTLFYLIRRKVYAPYYPQREWGEKLWIDEKNFHRAPKGTTCLFCDRELFLQSIPDRQGKTVSDDTLLLHNMVKRKKLLRHTALRITYLQRTDWKSVLAHIYQRGPLFNDYYLRGPSRYYRRWQAGLILFLLITGLIFYHPVFLLIPVAGLLFSAFYLSENLPDFLIVTTCLPLVGLTFLAGIIKGKISAASLRQIVQTLKAYNL